MSSKGTRIVTDQNGNTIRSVPTEVVSPPVIQHSDSAVFSSYQRQKLQLMADMVNLQKEFNKNSALFYQNTTLQLEKVSNNMVSIIEKLEKTRAEIITNSSDNVNQMMASTMNPLMGMLGNLTSAFGAPPSRQPPSTQHHESILDSTPIDAAEQTKPTQAMISDVDSDFGDSEPQPPTEIKKLDPVVPDATTEKSEPAVVAPTVSEPVPAPEPQVAVAVETSAPVAETQPAKSTDHSEASVTPATVTAVTSTPEEKKPTTTTAPVTIVAPAKKPATTVSVTSPPKKPSTTAPTTTTQKKPIKVESDSSDSEEDAPKKDQKKKPSASSKKSSKHDSSDSDSGSSSESEEDKKKKKHSNRKNDSDSEDDKKKKKGSSGRK